jgi:nucleotide-binding universal stress UspA family protein
VTSSALLETAGAAIARAAREHEALICMATHSRLGVGRAFLGSTAEEVLGLVSEPVLLVGPSCRYDSRPCGGELVVPLDGSPLADEILPAVRHAVTALGLRPWFVEVFGGSDELPTDVGETITVEAAARAMADVSPEVEWEILHGRNPAQRIVQFAQLLPASLIAMTTHGRTGFRRVTAGSVAMQIVRDAPCPVLVLRSSGSGTVEAVDGAGTSDALVGNGH